MESDLWLFVVWNAGRTWTRALVPAGIRTPRELVDYLKRGGKIESSWLYIPERAQFIPRVVEMTVLAQLVE